jgi:hypothetical protein
MRRVASCFLSLLLMAASGCGPPASTPLQITAGTLRRDMSHSEVNQLFTKFEGGILEEYHTNVETLLNHSGDQVLFRTNVDHGYRISYHPEGFFSAWEICTVFLDANEKVIGYSYTRQGYKQAHRQ